MKPETMIYDKVKDIIPMGSERTVFFTAVNQSSYEMLFYAFIDGKPRQCYQLAEQGYLDENELDKVFEKVVDIIKKSKIYDNEKINIVTIIVDKTGIRLNAEYYDKDTRIYKIEKEWKQKYI